MASSFVRGSRETRAVDIVPTRRDTRKCLAQARGRRREEMPALSSPPSTIGIEPSVAGGEGACSALRRLARRLEGRAGKYLRDAAVPTGATLDMAFPSLATRGATPTLRA
jgi:hypothetical protein